MPVTKYVALPRGINVGGKASIAIKELAEAGTELGWANVRTYLRTGNVA